MTSKIKQKGIILIPILISFLITLGISTLWLKAYSQIGFRQLSKFSEIIIENNPEVEALVLSSLKEYQEDPEKKIKEKSFLSQYGYDDRGFYNAIPWSFLTLSLIGFFVLTITFLISIGYLNKGKRLRIEELTLYLEQINTNIRGTMFSETEDDFSHLQDEIYKTVTALYQTRDLAVKAKMNFSDNLANISHQLKTPITAASLSLQLMEKTSPNPYIKPIKTQLKRLNRLEEALLTLSKIDAGVLQLKNSKVDLYTALTLAAENLEDLMNDKNISVSIPDKGLVDIQGDLEWTMEAFINLMKNCMEHSKRGGNIYSNYFSNPLYAKILIWDEGEGFNESDIPHLFERFYRGKDHSSNGIGIGLALTQSIFELQNGNITAYNLPQGGACFEIRVYRH